MGIRKERRVALQRVDRMIARIDGSAMRHYLLIASPVIAVFFIIPMQLFLNGRGYVDWSRLIPAGFVLAGLCVYLILAAAVWVLLKRRPRWAYLFSTAMFWLGLYVLLSFVFVPPKITLLDGRPLLSSQPLNRTIEQAVLFLLVVVAAFRVRSHRTSAFGLFTVTFLLVVSLSYGALVAASGHPAAHAADARRNTAVPGDISHGITGRPDTTIRGNVYHIVLDEMQGNVALARLRDKRNADAFPGFTFFKNTISNYLYTYQSFHSYFTGTVYDGVDYAKWVDGYKTGGPPERSPKKGIPDHRIYPRLPGFRQVPLGPFDERGGLQGEVRLASILDKRLYADLACQGDAQLRDQRRPRRRPQSGRTDRGFLGRAVVCGPCTHVRR